MTRQTLGAAAYVRMGIVAIAGAPVLWCCRAIFHAALGWPR